MTVTSDFVCQGKAISAVSFIEIRHRGSEKLPKYYTFEEIHRLGRLLFPLLP